MFVKRRILTPAVLDIRYTMHIESILNPSDLETSTSLPVPRQPLQPPAFTKAKRVVNGSDPQMSTSAAKLYQPLQPRVSHEGEALLRDEVDSIFDEHYHGANPASMPNEGSSEEPNDQVASKQNVVPNSNKSAAKSGSRQVTHTAGTIMPGSQDTQSDYTQTKSSSGARINPRAAAASRGIAHKDVGFDPMVSHDARAYVAVSKFTPMDYDVHFYNEADSTMTEAAYQTLHLDVEVLRPDAQSLPNSQKELSFSAEQTRPQPANDASATPSLSLITPPDEQSSHEDENGFRYEKDWPGRMRKGSAWLCPVPCDRGVWEAFWRDRGRAV